MRPKDAPAPDYTDPAHWLAWPGTGDFWPTRPGIKPADLFYIHPTTVEGSGWNQDFADTHPNRRADRGVIARQISAFADVCRLFVPRYRQATSMAFRRPGAEAEAAYDLAYVDVRAAFGHYLRHGNDGRGFILCGHSQGAVHVGRLVEEVIEADFMRRQMIAAYAVGIGFSEGLFGTRYRQVMPCLHPDQTACLISWNCFLSGADPTGFLQRTRARDSARLGGAAVGLPLCINPISFDSERPDVGAAENPGTLAAGPAEWSLPELIPGLVGARCSGGVAWVSPAPDPAHGLQPLPGGNMHMHEIALFHAALQQDAGRRAAAHARQTNA